MFQKILQGGSDGNIKNIDMASAKFSHSNQGAFIDLYINGTTETVALPNYNQSGTTELFEVSRGTSTYTFTFLKEVYFYDNNNISSKKKYGIGETYSYTGSNFSHMLMFAFIS